MKEADSGGTVKQAICGIREGSSQNVFIFLSTPLGVIFPVLKIFLKTFEKQGQLSEKIQQLDSRGVTSPGTLKTK